MSRKILLRKSTKKAHGDLCFIEHAAPVEIEHREVDDDLADIIPGYLTAARLHIVQQAADVLSSMLNSSEHRQRYDAAGSVSIACELSPLVDEKKDLV